ncbi:hypothetical protein BJY52DRAFT_932738 [Lactarius psammicola]|nr:hypothetical protein BJY52DRAFT_932738 [Lactarius psammicola]
MQEQSFVYNGLYSAMALANPTLIPLPQLGVSSKVYVLGNAMEILRLLGSGSLGTCFDDYLDVVNRSFCTFQGGDVPNQDGGFK